MKRLRFFILVTLLVVTSLGGPTTARFLEEDLIVEAGTLGKIQGVNVSTVGSQPRQFYSFLSIPYAKKTLDAGRFLPSEMAEEELVPGGGTFNATVAGPACIQPQSFLFTQSEDCLTINVNTPKLYTGNSSELLPVIFYIHGGAFTAGLGSTYNGKFLLNRDVVLVTFNYRLGVLGFFSLNQEDAPGNAAMHDIVNALRWTKKYISYFGGDDNKITIAGQSAGSVAVTHLLAMPAAAGLFQGAIGASGSALAAWGTKDNSADIEDNLQIANLTGCYDPASRFPNESMIISCMRAAKPEVLVSALYTYQVTERRQGRLGFSVISPVVQTFNTSESYTKLITEHPKDVFEKGTQANVSLMMGATRHDGSYVLGVYYNRLLKDNGYVNDTEFMTKRAVPQILETLGIPNEYGVYDSIAKMYLGDTRKSGNFWEMYPGFIDLFSVFFFKASSYQTALFHTAQGNPTFWYSFDYAGRHTLFSTLFALGEVPPFKGGITHSDDILYLFDMTPFFFLNDEERAVSNQMVDYWVNFATYGNPTPDTNSSQWPALTIDDPMFLSIGKAPQEQKHYDDAWSGIGWEVVEPITTPPPSTTTPQTTMLPTTTMPPTTMSPTEDSSTNPPTSQTEEITSPTSSEEPTDNPQGNGGTLPSCTSLSALIVFVTICTMYN